MTVSSITEPQRRLVEMSWDPVTRIIGNLGIYTKIDFDNREVVECKSTSSIFRGYSVFMRGKDPRDSHFITSRICGICGDNHATCSIYAQNMAYGIKTPPTRRVDLQPRRGRRVHVRPLHLPGQPGVRGLLRADGPGDEPARCSPRPSGRPRRTRTSTATARSPTSCGRSTRSRARRTARRSSMSRLTREMFCLMEGRHVHPSTLYPGGTGTVASPQVFSDYLVAPASSSSTSRRSSCRSTTTCSTSSTRRCRATSGSAQRRVLLGCWGAFQDPGRRRLPLRDDDRSGDARCTSRPASSSTASSSRRTSSRSTSASASCSATRSTRTGSTASRSCREDPLGNPVDPRHPWNQTTIPKPQKRDLENGPYSWVMSPRWYHAKTKEHLALDTGGGPLARLWVTALANLVKTPYVQATGKQRANPAPEDRVVRRDGARVEDAAVVEHDRARPRARLLHRVRRGDGAVLRREGDASACTRATSARSRSSRSRTRRSAAASTRPCAACSRTTSSSARGRSRTTTRTRRLRGTRARATSSAHRDRTRTPCRACRSSRRTAPTNFKGIDIMRTVRSFDPCLPCGVHMYVGDGRIIEARHSPMFGVSK